MSLSKEIRSKLYEQLHPIHLEVICESDRHNVPEGTEMHFKVIIAAEQFTGLSPVARHQLVYSLLDDEIASKRIHALVLHTMTPQEWAEKGGIPESPPCRGGSKN